MGDTFARRLARLEEARILRAAAAVREEWQRFTDCWLAGGRAGGAGAGSDDADRAVRAAVEAVLDAVEAPRPAPPAVRAAAVELARVAPWPSDLPPPVTLAWLADEIAGRRAELGERTGGAA